MKTNEFIIREAKEEEEIKNEIEKFLVQKFDVFKKEDANETKK